MNIDVTVNKSIARQVCANKIAEAAEFYARILISEKLISNLDIEVVVEKDGDVAGSCTWEDRYQVYNQVRDQVREQL